MKAKLQKKTLAAMVKLNVAQAQRVIYFARRDLGEDLGGFGSIDLLADADAFNTWSLHKLKHLWNVADHVHCPVALSELFTPFIEELMALARGQEEGYEDLAAYYAPSECYADVAHWNKRDTEQLMEKYGWTAESFWRECKKRGLSEKWTYSCIPQIEWEY